MFGPLLRREASSKCLVCNLVSSSFRGLETALHGWATSNSFKHHVSVPTHNRSNRIWTTDRLWLICLKHFGRKLCCSWRYRPLLFPSSRGNTHIGEIATCHLCRIIRGWFLFPYNKLYNKIKVFVIPMFFFLIFIPKTQPICFSLSTST